jgi:hypothetical protein
MKPYCKVCREHKKRMVRHHVAYKKYGQDERMIDLCEECHNFLHRFVRGSDEDLEFVTKQFIRAGKFWK